MYDTVTQFVDDDDFPLPSPPSPCVPDGTPLPPPPDELSLVMNQCTKDKTQVFC